MCIDEYLLNFNFNRQCQQILWTSCKEGSRQLWSNRSNSLVLRVGIGLEWIEPTVHKILETVIRNSPGKLHYSRELSEKGIKVWPILRILPDSWTAVRLLPALDVACMRETHETALLHVACGNPARRCYCMGGKFSSKIRKNHWFMRMWTRTYTCAILVTVKSAVLGADFHTHGQPASHIASSIIVRLCNKLSS